MKLTLTPDEGDHGIDGTSPTQRAVSIFWKNRASGFRFEDGTIAVPH
jgi:hypothetical protein